MNRSTISMFLVLFFFLKKFETFTLWPYDVTILCPPLTHIPEVKVNDDWGVMQLDRTHIPNSTQFMKCNKGSMPSSKPLHLLFFTHTQQVHLLVKPTITSSSLSHHLLQPLWFQVHLIRLLKDTRTICRASRSLASKIQCYQSSIDYSIFYSHA